RRRRARPALGCPRLCRLPPQARRGAGAPRPPRRAGERMNAASEHTILVHVNGTAYEREVEARRLLVHLLRDDLDLTGTHVGCDTGNCGACSVIVDGTLVKSCMMLAV